MSRAGYADFFPAAPSVLAKKAQAERAAKQKARSASIDSSREQRHEASSASTADDHAVAAAAAPSTDVRDPTAAGEDRTAAGDSSANSALPTATTSGSTTATSSHSNPSLTPTTSHSSPPTQMSPGAATAKEAESRASSIATTNGAAVAAPGDRDRKDVAAPPQPPPSLLTPKATPPATSLKSEPLSSRRDRTSGSSRTRESRDYDDRSRPAASSPRPTEADRIRAPPPQPAPSIPDPRKDIPNYTDGPKTGKRKVRTHLQRVYWQWDANYIGPGPPNQILITGLSPLTTEAEVLMNFRQFGDVQTSKMEIDPATGGSLGVCSIVYRDNKADRVLGHQAARAAVQKGSGMNIAMQKIHVTLDRDGHKCQKVVAGILRTAQRKQEEARRREEEEAAKRRPPPTAPKTGEAGDRTHPVRPDGHRISDLDARFVKPRAPGAKAIDDLGTRPAVFISCRDVPAELKYCKHLYGRLRNFGVEDVLYDRSGFFVVFKEVYGMERCYKVCHRDTLFNFIMNMTMYPHGNPEAKKREQMEKERRERKRKVRKLDPIDPVTETANSLISDLRTALMGDVRKRLADVLIYDMLAPEKLKERAKKEEVTAGDKPAVAIENPADGAPSVEASMSAAPPSTQKPSISSLPRFKKRPLKRGVTPASDASSRFKRTRHEARPLMHRLNDYDIDHSEDESSRPSRAMSTEYDEEDSVMTDAPRRKRKRSPGVNTPSRLREKTYSSDDESEDRSRPKDPEDVQAELDREMAEFIVDESEDEDDEDIPRKSRKIDRSLRAEDAIFTPSASEDEAEARRKRVKSVDEDGDIDLTGSLDTIDTVMNDEFKKDEEGSPPIPTPIDMEDEPPLESAVEMDEAWKKPTSDKPRPAVEDDDDIILDLDGMQNLVKDDEDFRFLRQALAGTPKADIGNIHAYAVGLKEFKAANRDGKRGVVTEPDRIEGFYRPNPSGCARTEGYRRIPEAEKSMYLPHRLAVAAKRANAANNPEKTPSAPSSAPKPVSSSRMNRVNNRRLVAELNNQKQILSADADVMRFNQLKKRKKPVKFARSAIHNWGLYAMENIAANDMIIEYVGEKVRQQVADLRERYYLKSGIGSSYLFRIDENTVIDATKRGGIARFINHSCTPNCTAKIIKVEGSKRIVIYALRDIKENEELTYDYKFERELDSEERIPCLCGSSGCKGFLN